MEEEMMKKCDLCSHYGSLVNQGMWWCTAGHTKNMNPETCGDYDGAYEGETITTATSLLSNVNVVPYSGITTQKPMKQYKISRAKRKRKIEKHIKHGRR